jgi:hypothetical protein
MALLRKIGLFKIPEKEDQMGAVEEYNEARNEDFQILICAIIQKVATNELLALDFASPPANYSMLVQFINEVLHFNLEDCQYIAVAMSSKGLTHQTGEGQIQTIIENNFGKLAQLKDPEAWKEVLEPST